MRTFFASLREALKIFASRRRLWLPFIVAAVVEAFFVFLVWLAPQSPFSKLLAPPVRYFFGDRILHYPLHLWFLYHSMKHAHLVASIVAGAFMTGIACAMAAQANAGLNISLRDAIASGRVKYSRMVLIWVATWLLAKLITESVASLAGRAVWAIWVNIGFLFILQALFAYAIPSAVFEGLSWWRAILRGIREAVRYPISTLFMILIPSVLAVIFSITVSSATVAQNMQRTVPEIAVLFVALRLLVLTLADGFLTVGVAYLWLNHSKAKDSASAGTSSASCS